MNPTKTYTPINKPISHGVYYVAKRGKGYKSPDTFERVVVLMDERGNLEAHGPTFNGERLYDIYAQWFVPVLPPVADCIEYVELAGWKLQYRNGGRWEPLTYHFHSIKPRAGLNSLTFTLSEIRDAYRNGF